LDETHGFFDYGYALDFAASVAVPWNCGSAPCGDESGVFDLVGDIVG
jgi:hypothetical protein